MPGRELFETVVDQTMLMKREQTPEDIGKLAAFLASDDAKNITNEDELDDASSPLTGEE
ncbi:MAG: hypothetical protein J4G14_11630 [Dehalococcoidia bacterium]|nr:hypothetical protein [Dehalococcoidia bacterium]